MKNMLASMLVALISAASANAAEAGMHLFILSGQSNMVGMNPATSFTPAVEKAFGKDNVINPEWDQMRQIQVGLSESLPNAAWVDTDDLNDGVNPLGRAITNSLHYTREGYKTLGQRFADKAIELIGN